MQHHGGHVAYQIKWHHECSNMILKHALDPWGGIKNQTFFYLNVVMRKECNIEHNVSTYFVLTLWWGQKVKTFFSESSQIKLKGI